MMSPSTNQVMQQIPSILQRKHLKCLHHTPETAQILHDTYGFFANGREMSHEVEQHLFDAFIEDDYDGRLHLMTLHCLENEGENGGESLALVAKDDILMPSSFGKGIGPPLGIVFWRDVPDEEMKEWFDWNFLAKALNRGEGLTHNGTNPSKISHNKSTNKDQFISLPTATTALHLVRQSSIDSIKKMVADMQPGSSISTSICHNNEDRKNILDVETLSHAWIKLELIAIRQQYWGHHLGSLLLSCTLYHAHYESNQSRVLLHVAGGEENVPAVRLYEKFGFHPVRQNTIFHKPDRFMYVLGDISSSLGGVTWKQGVLESVNNHNDT